MRTSRQQTQALDGVRPSPFILGLLLSLALLLFPSFAQAQTDAIRIMAGRVLDNARFPVGTNRGGRDDVIWRDADRREADRRDRDGRWDNERYDRRSAQQIRKEQKAREQFCRKHPRERICRQGIGYGYGLENRRGNNAAWCWDRNRDGRCDANQAAARRGPGRGLALGRR